MKRGAKKRAERRVGRHIITAKKENAGWHLSLGD